MEPQRKMSCTGSIVISQPTETVFSYLSNPRHFLFNAENLERQGEEGKQTYRFFGIPFTFKVARSQVIEINQLTPEPVGVGTIFEQVSTLHGRIQKSKIKVVEYDPPGSMTLSCSPLPLIERVILTPAEENTILSITLTMNIGCFPLIEFFWTSMTKQEMQNWLKRLKISLEDSDL